MRRAKLKRDRDTFQDCLVLMYAGADASKPDIHATFGNDREFSYAQTLPPACRIADSDVFVYHPAPGLELEKFWPFRAWHIVSNHAQTENKLNNLLASVMVVLKDVPALCPHTNVIAQARRGAKGKITIDYQVIDVLKVRALQQKLAVMRKGKG